MSTLFRIDLRFSGAFAEQPDGNITGFSEGAEGLAFELNEDLVDSDLTDGLQNLGIDSAKITRVETDKAVFQPPSAFDAQASGETSCPVFGQGATWTQFIRVNANASDALTMAIHNAFTMASVTVTWQGLAAYDDFPTVAVNAINQLDDVVDPRAPHERRADGLVAAINSAVESSEES